MVHFQIYFSRRQSILWENFISHFLLTFTRSLISCRFYLLLFSLEPVKHEYTCQICKLDFLGKEAPYGKCSFYISDLFSHLVLFIKSFLIQLYHWLRNTLYIQLCSRSYQPKVQFPLLLITPYTGCSRYYQPVFSCERKVLETNKRIKSFTVFYDQYNIA